MNGASSPVQSRSADDDLNRHRCDGLWLLLWLHNGISMHHYKQMEEMCGGLGSAGVLWCLLGSDAAVSYEQWRQL